MTGIDGSAEMVVAARSFVGAATTPRYTLPRFEVQNIEEFATPAERFDGVICLNVIEYLKSPASSFADLAAALRPGGTLVLSAPNRASLVRRAQLGARAALKPFGRSAFAYLDSSGHSWTCAELADMATQNGLEPVAVLGFDPLLPRAVHGLAQPSLFYLISRKPAAGEAS